jgi:hypothetical protein
MARINFESEIRADARFKALVRKLRNEREAIGLMIDLWEVAQKYWGRDRSLIPKKVFTLGDFGAAVEVGFAEEQDDGFYVRGAGEHFEWLASKRDSASAGGRASAAARKKKYGSAVPANAPYNSPQETEAKSKQRSKRCSKKVEAEIEAKSNALTLTLTPALTLALTQEENTNTRIPFAAPKVQRTKKEPSQGPLVWDAYSSAYEMRYGTNPVRNAKANANCSQLVARLGIDAPSVAAFFLTHNDSWYVKHLHPLGFLIRDAEKLHTEWKVGSQMTGTKARAIETVANNQSAVAEYLTARGGQSAI